MFDKTEYYDSIPNEGMYNFKIKLPLQAEIIFFVRTICEIFPNV